LEALYAAYAAAVHAYARRRVDPAAAEDVVADTFLVAWRRLDALPAADPLPWLLATARHVVANQRRGDARRAALTARIGAEAASVARSAWPERGVSDNGERLLRALASLRPADREALLLVAWEGLTPERAAAALECSRPAFHVRLHRARRRLKTAMESDMGPAPSRPHAEQREARSPAPTDPLAPVDERHAEARE
jgi:RNA polymerase sigma-70 factor (ECF subfamily)